MAGLFLLLMGCTKLFRLANSFNTYREIQRKCHIGYIPAPNASDFNFDLGSVDERIETHERVQDDPRPKEYPRYLSTIERVPKRDG